MINRRLHNGSQRHEVALDGCSNAGIYRVRGDNVHACPKEILEVSFKTHQGEETAAGRKIDEDVDVAAGTFTASGDAAEHSNIGRAMASGHVEDVPSVSAYASPQWPAKPAST